MSNNLRILQLASFEGNIGDNANITGTRRFLRKNFNYNITFENLEIREFFWKERFFDSNFADYVNTFDLFLFGGGNFFELWVDNSCNNTSVDIDIPILKEIKTPTVFYSLGLDPGMGVTDLGITKFKRWLDYVNNEKRFVLSLRNDGSFEAAEQLLGKDYAEHFYQVPDGGFFTEVMNTSHIEIPDSKMIIGLNLAGDMLDIRFPNNTLSSISFNEFLVSLGDLFNRMFEKHDSFHLVLFPHIYKDLDIISQFLSKLKDKHIRQRVTVAPYLHGFNAQSYIFDAYSKCNIIMGNRFHTNVCAIGLNIPTIGFINYRQIEKLYEELGIKERAIKVNQKGFENILQDSIDNTFKNTVQIKNSYHDICQSLAAQTNQFHSFLNTWLKDFIYS